MRLARPRPRRHLARPPAPCPPDPLTPLAPLGAVDDPIDATRTLDDPLGALVLALMSRLLAARAVAALAEGDGLRVAVAKGTGGLAVGDAVDEAALAPDFPLIVPLRHGGRRFGVVGLGPRLGGAGYGAAEEGLARSLANATAATLAAQQSAQALVVANRALAARAHGLRTLLELAQTFGQALDREAIAGQIARSLMGQLLVPRVAVALCNDDDGPLETVLTRGAEAPVVPRALDRHRHRHRRRGWRPAGAARCHRGPRAGRDVALGRPAPGRRSVARRGRARRALRDPTRLAPGP